MRIPNLLLGLLCIASTTLGCHPHDAGWDRINGNVTKTIEDFCNFAGITFKGHERKQKCYKFGNWKLDMSLGNNQGSVQGIPTEECVYTFMNVKEDCWSGSDQPSNGFQYRIDPYHGLCGTRCRIWRPRVGKPGGSK